MSSTLLWNRWLLFIAITLISVSASEAQTPNPAPVANQEREIPASVIFARVAPSVLVVQCARNGGETQGSAVVIDTDQVVTSYHVIEGAASIQVKQGSQSWKATLLAFDQQHDLAILSVPQLDRPRVALRPSSLVKVGERTFAVSAPRGLELSLSDGLVAALRSPKGDLARSGGPAGKAAAPGSGSDSESSPSLIQTTAPVSPGSSGGGLFDNQGRLIGIITFVANGQNLNFAHPSEWVAELSQGPRKDKSHPPEPKPAPPHSISARPALIICKMRTTATWALFSGGTEMLESGKFKDKWTFERFNTQLIQYTTESPGAHQDNFVLADMDRQSGFVRFSRAIAGPRFELFFWMDDQGTFHVTSAEGFNFYGQLRIRTISGECNPPPVEPERPIAIPVVHTCKSGATAVCIKEGRNSLERKQPIDALQSFILACDQEEPTGCEEAAKICDEMKLQQKARDLRQRAALLRSKNE